MTLFTSRRSGRGEDPLKEALPAEQTRAGLSASTRQSGPIATAFGGLIAIAAALGIGRFVYTPILPPMVETLGLTKSQAGLIASANFVGYLFGALLAAMPRLAGSRRLWLLGALAASALTTAAMGLTQSLAAFLVLRAIGGAASAFVLIFSSTIVLERLAEAGRGGLSALHFAGVGSGIAVSAALVTELLQLQQSWQVLWLASGGLTLAGLLAAAILLPDSTPPSTHRKESPARIASDRSLQRLVNEVSGEFQPAEFHYNPMGSVHGGVISTLLDSVMGLSVLTQLPPRCTWSALEIKVNFVRPISMATGTLVAEGKVVHSGSRIPIAEGRLVDQGGKLHAHGTTTCFVLRETA